MKRVRTGRMMMVSLLLASAGAAADAADRIGPFNLRFFEGGLGLSRPLEPQSPGVGDQAAFSFTGWLKVERVQPGAVIVAGLGDPASSACRCLSLRGGELSFAMGGREISTHRPLAPGRWYNLAVTFDGGIARLYVDGKLAGSAAAHGNAVQPLLALAPTLPGTTGLEGRHFGGALAGFSIVPEALTPTQVASLAKARPDFDLISFNQPGAGWSVQVRQQAGLQQPQDPWTLPAGKAGFSPAITKPVPSVPSLQKLDEHQWRINGWRLAEGPEVKSSGAELSRVGFDDKRWYAATVPGTVLQTLIDRGVYPDPDIGLNNLAIPERLARQDYWYRSEFDVPPSATRRERELLFKGINYAAEIWLNGERIGSVRGAFIRGRFNVSGKLRTGRNALAVRISPPPHPGIPHEESVSAGPGENGGMVALDGPTFVSAEGWDWIPGVRDRNSGLWQEVDLVETGSVHILDPKVVTDLPLPRTDSARVTIEVPVLNSSSHPVQTRLKARFEGVAVEKTVTAPPGLSTIIMTPEEFPVLRLAQPRLWWPNGYGDPSLYHLQLTATADGAQSDSKTLRFGVREYSYELSLFDSSGRLRRVDVDFTDARAGEKIVDVRHEAIKQTPNGWVQSLTRSGEKSKAVTEIEATSPLPHLAIRINGVRVAARGGSWGMDDMLKRISRDRLEPYFRLHKAANVNIIRNWMGTNSEDIFYDLADEYGLMVLNDFWASTQDFQLEPQDPQLFLANARDTINRYRNHPSIVIWFGRNEGVPQPIINEGLDELTAELDGTRWYTGSSNTVNLQGSGPYNYRPPVGYFTDLASGFSVETGSPSLATLEAIEAMVPAPDRWPLGDTIAYHDWHFGGNGDVKSFMETLSAQFGPATSLEDFERKAQMMNFVTYRAIFEGMSAHLWTKNMGRLLWMTHPAWPSNHWQIYSHDYDTHASYYGVKHANEPVHVQMNLPEYGVAVVNTTRAPMERLTVEASIYDLSGNQLYTHNSALSAAANQTTTLPPLPLASILETQGLAFIKLRLKAADGALLSENFYWQGKDAQSYQKLNDLPKQRLSMNASSEVSADEFVTRVRMSNTSRAPVLQAKLTLLDQQGKRVLPAYYSDNYVSMLPGEEMIVEIRSSKAAEKPARIGFRGWNLEPGEVVLEKVH